MKTIKPFDDFVNKSIINEGNGQTVKEFGDLLALLLDKENGLDIERAINALDSKEARTLSKQISELYKKLFKLTNDGFGLRGTNEGTTINEGHRLQGVWDYCIADPMGTRVFKKFGISGEDANEIQEICYDVMKRVGDKGSSVLGGGLEINGQPFLRNYSQGNIGPEEIYAKVKKLLNDKYPKLKVVQKYGRMD